MEFGRLNLSGTIPIPSCCPLGDPSEISKWTEIPEDLFEEPINLKAYLRGVYRIKRRVTKGCSDICLIINTYVLIVGDAMGAFMRHKKIKLPQKLSYDGFGLAHEHIYKKAHEYFTYFPIGAQSPTPATHAKVILDNARVARNKICHNNFSNGKYFEFHKKSAVIRNLLLVEIRKSS
jgi:hypothetical protein